MSYSRWPRPVALDASNTARTIDDPWQKYDSRRGSDAFEVEAAREIAVDFPIVASASFAKSAETCLCVPYAYSSTPAASSEDRSEDGFESVLRTLHLGARTDLTLAPHWILARE